MIWFCLFTAIVATVLIMIASIRESKELDLAADRSGKCPYRLGRLAVLPVPLAVVGVALIVGECIYATTGIMHWIGIVLTGLGALFGLLILGVHYLVFLRRKHMHSHHFLPCALLEIIALLACLIYCVLAA